MKVEEREVSALLRLVFAERGKTGRLDLEAVEMAKRAALHRAGACALTWTARGANAILALRSGHFNGRLRITGRAGRQPDFHSPETAHDLAARHDRALLPKSLTPRDARPVRSPETAHDLAAPPGSGCCCRFLWRRASRPVRSP